MLHIFTRLLFGLFISCSVNAGLLNIVIDDGRQAGLPIMIQPFEINSTLPDNTTDITNVIRRDLANSGQFTPTTDLAIAESIIQGSITETDTELYTIQFKLLDAILNKQITHLEFTSVKTSEFRALAHHISDVVFKQIIGVPGTFSTRIAYIAVTTNPADKKPRYSIKIADSDGANAQSVISSRYPLMSPSWSPDGNHLAYVSFHGERSAINIVNTATGKIKQISKHSGINGAPTWSPDGNELAIVLSKSGSPNIYTLNLKDNQLSQLTRGSSISTEPNWAPDGKSIVFTSNRGGKPQVYRVKLISKKIQRLTFIGNYNARPRLTPDGKKLITMHRENGDSNFNIAALTLDTGKFKILTHSKLDESPSLSPNGMMVLYETSQTGRRTLATVTLDGRFQMNLPAQLGDIKEPSWSPYL